MVGQDKGTVRNNIYAVLSASVTPSTRLIEVLVSNLTVGDLMYRQGRNDGGPAIRATQYGKAVSDHIKPFPKAAGLLGPFYRARIPGTVGTSSRKDCPALAPSFWNTAYKTLITSAAWAGSVADLRCDEAGLEHCQEAYTAASSLPKRGKARLYRLLALCRSPLKDCS